MHHRRSKQHPESNTLDQGRSSSPSQRPSSPSSKVKVKSKASRSLGKDKEYSSDDEITNGGTVSALETEAQRQSRRLFYAVASLIVLMIWLGVPTKQEEKPAAVPVVKDVARKTSTYVRKKRWNPCLDNSYALEKHPHVTLHGDVCRNVGSESTFECPEGCHETAGAPPLCANTETAESSESKTIGDKGAACRVRDPKAPLEYRCDYGSICVMAVGSPWEYFKGNGQYYDDTCDNKCGDGRTGELTLWVVQGGRCTTDMDCSLAGTCNAENGKCECDSWAEGADCSYLKFAPVDKSRLGYVHEDHSSWGGSIVQKKESGEYQMYVSEILCKDYDSMLANKKKRCGLNNWETHSRIALATSSNVEGPYERQGEVLHPEHHNPSIHISPKTGDWHLFTISGPTGPIERIISSDEGVTWGDPMIVSPRVNPGPLLKDDGSTQLFYRADGLDIPGPTCSDRGISVQHCPSDDAPCAEPNDLLTFGHTGEDPSVFVDHRGYYHMLFNAMPYKCVPKFQQGGHSWSIDGINWKTPRIGAFDTTVNFTDGSSMQCERRERPQMVVDKDGMPLALSSGVTGCPTSLGDESLDGAGRFYRGGDDSFTLIQKMGSGTE